MENIDKRLRFLDLEARRLRKAEDWGCAAIEINTKMLELDPDNVMAINRRARCYREQGNLIAAEADYRRALGLRPRDKNIRNALDELKNEANRRRERENFIRRVRSIEVFAEAHRIGREYKAKSPFKRLIAVEAFRQAFRLDRTRIDVLIELAAVHRTLRERDEAERIYEWILRRWENAAAKVGLAAIYKDQKRLRDALRLCDEVLSRDPHNRYALRCRAGVLSDLDRGTEAARAFGKSFGT